MKVHTERPVLTSYRVAKIVAAWKSVVTSPGWYQPTYMSGPTGTTPPAPYPNAVSAVKPDSRTSRAASAPDCATAVRMVDRSGVYRMAAPAQHEKAFYEAFGIRAGDRMWLDPSDRVTIW